VNKKSHTRENNTEEYESGSAGRSHVDWYVILICGLIILGIGIYLYTTNSVAGGIALSRRRNGAIDGTTAIILGLGICALPTYQLIKISSQRKRRAD
jgi:hypothetical protein